MLCIFSMTMDLRSSRSRSKTPFVQTTLEQQEVISTNEQNHVIEETIVKHSYSMRNRAVKANNSNSTITEEVFEAPVTTTKTKSQKTNNRSRHKTSDYSSEEGENEISSSKGNGLTRSQTSAEKSLSKNGEVKSALQVYKEAGEYWNKYPKTDYTYSIHSKDRVELAPGVVAMPNMSRRSLRRSTESTSSIPASNVQKSTAFYSEEVSRLNHGYRYDHNTNLARKALFQDEVDSDYEYERYEEVKQISVFRRFVQSFSSTVTRIITSILTILTIISHNSVKPVLWIGRGYYKAVSRLLLLDTWLLQSSSGNRKWGPLIALMLLPLLIFTGLHLAQAHGVPLVPNCYPHCGRIATSYFNSLIDTFYSAQHTT